MSTTIASSNDIAMILIKTVTNRVVVRGIFQRTLRVIIARSEGGRMLVAINNDMATIMASSNTISMILIMTVINEVMVSPIGVAPYMESITAITVVGVKSEVVGW